MRKLQFDHRVRIVSLENLLAMCKRVSGVCHRYTVEKVTPNRVYVQYSNPNEYGNENPMTAVFPCYPSAPEWGDNDNPAVVLEYHRIIHDNQDGEGWHSFECLRDCPELFRNPTNGEWNTREEIEGKN